MVSKELGIVNKEMTISMIGSQISQGIVHNNSAAFKSDGTKLNDSRFFNN